MCKSNKNGFTLIEVVVALAIFSIGIVALLGVYRTGLGHQRRALEKSFALSLAEEKLNEASALKVGLSLTGEIKHLNQVYHWQREARPVQAGLIEWEMSVRWGTLDSNQVRLSRWIRE